MNADRKMTTPGVLLLIVAVYVTLIGVVYLVQKAAALDKGLIEKAESLYNNIFIYKDKTGHLYMVFGYRNRKFEESVHNPQDALELSVKYTQLMSLGAVYAAELKDMLQIGMGGGKTSRYMEFYIPQLRITEVELDPDVVKLAKKYFDYAETDRLKAMVSDGRKFLMQNDHRYDLIMIDAYRGPFVPFHLLTVNFYQEVKKHLSPGGAVVQNIATDTMLFDSAVATMRAVFDQVEFYPADGNVVAIAYDGAAKSMQELQDKAAALQEKYHFRYPLPDMVVKRQAFTPAPTALPLTDDFAPVDSLKSIETHNTKWN